MKDQGSASSGLAAGTFAVMIAATCLLLGNLYYAQPILPEIAGALQIATEDSGLIVAFGQAGYISGLLFLAPLGDFADNRKLCAGMTLGAAILTLLATTTTVKGIFFLSLFCMGAFATATQILVVLAASMAGASKAGKTLGIMACGLFSGIALSRPFSGIVTASLGWRYVYGFSSFSLFALALALWAILPARKEAAQHKIGYFRILGEMLTLPRHAKSFVRNTAISFFAFSGFTMFWSSAPLYLAEGFHCDPDYIALFTTTGLITPPAMLLVGRMLDAGKGTTIIGASLCIIVLGWLCAWLAPMGLWLFFLAALLIDPCSSSTTVSVQKSILASVSADKRGRANSLNISLNFLGGAIGAAIGPWLLGQFSWSWVAIAGMLVTSGLAIFNFCAQFSKRRMQDG